jgi:hypothetical protein
MNWSVIAAVNNEEVTKSCLLRSPDLRFASEMLLQRNYRSASVAYNEAIEQAKSDFLVFVHQDVYVPAGWIGAVQNAVTVLSQKDPDWGVLGVWGITSSGQGAGFLYDGGWRSIRGRAFQGGIEVECLDEVVLILRKSTGLKFDPLLTGFHMYGADICLEARHQRRKCYAIGALCIHNTNQYHLLPWQFWRCYLTLRRKWKAELPIKTTCTEITRWCWPMVRWNVVRAINLATGRDKPPNKRVQDPSRLYLQLIHSGTIAPPECP